MAKKIPKTRNAPSASTIIPTYSLSGGVTTQAQSKRLPNEASDLTNCIVSLERSVEKRSGLQLLLPDNYNSTISSTLTTNNQQKFNNTGGWSITNGSSTITITRTDSNQKLPIVGDKVYFYKHIYSTGGTTQANVAKDVFGYDPTQSGLTTSALSYVYYTVTSISSNSFQVTGKSTSITATGTLNYYILKQSERLDLANLEHHIAKEGGDAVGGVYPWNSSSGVDYFFYWFNINELNRFLIVINYRASAANQPILFVYRITSTGSFIDETQYSDAQKTQQDPNIISDITRAYITYGSTNQFGTNFARNVLKATAVGNSLVILNTLVKAGFTSGEIGWNGSSTGGKLFNFDGSESTSIDTEGNFVQYYSSARYIKSSTGKWHLIGTDSNDEQSLVAGTFPNPSTATTNLKAKKTITLNASSQNAPEYVIGNWVQCFSSRNDNLNIGTCTVGTVSGTGPYTATVTCTSAPSLRVGDYITSVGVGGTLAGATITAIASATSFTVTKPGTLTAGSNTIVTVTRQPVSPPLPDVGTLNQWKETLSWTGSGTTTITGMPTGYTKVNPSTQTKVYFISTSHTDANPKYLVCSSWTNDANVPGGGAINSQGIEGSVWFIEQKVGTWTNGPTPFNPANLENVYCFIGYSPEVDDFVWHDSSNAYLGQSLPDFSYIKFPPEYAGEVLGSNGVTFTDSTSPTALTYTIDISAKSMLNATTALNNGNGKIYYTQAPYLNFTSGYYRVISASSKPYTKKIRTPDCYSVLDKRRMPQKIIFNSTATYKFTANPIEWITRTSGDRYSNPGPSVFLTTDKKPKQVEIKALSVFRDRLYFAAEDVIFSSQLGVYEDLFLADPSNIIATDPIDIRASNNSYAEISSLTPFSSYLFINTSGNVQYELKGSQNQITPLTAEISPTSFYSTAKFLEPKLLGSLIYFFDKQRLYLYLGSENSDLATAQELTVTSAGFLPFLLQDICIAPSQNNIIMLGNQFSKNETTQGSQEIYFHCSRFAGDKNLQNAFWKWETTSSINGSKIVSIQSFDDYLYAVIKVPSTRHISYINPITSNLTTTSVNAGHQYYKYFIVRSLLKPEIFNLLSDTEVWNNTEILPRLDNLLFTYLTDNNSDYSFSTNLTTIRLPLSYNLWGYSNILLDPSYTNINLITTSTPSIGNWYTDLTGKDASTTTDRTNEVASPISLEVYDCFTEFNFSGRYVPTSYNATTKSLNVDYSSIRSLWFGCPFKMNIELSEQFVRDQNNSVIDGSLNLKSMSLRHKFTGQYSVVIKNLMNSQERTYVFTPQSLNTTDTLALEFYETEGSFNCPVLGFSNQTKISITSKNPYPLNISYIEFNGKFMRKKSITDLY